MLGDGLITVLPDGPAVEVSFGEVVQHMRDLRGWQLAQPGGLSGRQPDAPRAAVPADRGADPMLATMSFLALELGEEEDSFAPALRWAAKRSEIAILCAEGFGDVEAAVWAAAPDRLKNHCYLVTTGDRDPASARARGLFDAVVHAPDPSEASPPLSVLKRRLVTDISDARQEDVDAAALFLHRFREAEILPPQSAFDDSAAQAPDPVGRRDDACRRSMPVPAACAATGRSAKPSRSFGESLREARAIPSPRPRPDPEPRTCQRPGLRRTR
jgi:hypothetical protein